jgi:hypothetical protein
MTGDRIAVRLEQPNDTDGRWTWAVVLAETGKPVAEAPANKAWPEAEAALRDARTWVAARERQAARPESRVYLAATTGLFPGSWAKGPTPEAAVAAMKKEGRLRANARVAYKVYRVHPATRIDGYGMISFPSGHRYEVVEDVNPDKKRKLVACA